MGSWLRRQWRTPSASVESGAALKLLPGRHALPTSAEKECEAAWHHLQHLLHKEAALAAAEKGKGPAQGGDASGEGGDAAGSGGPGLGAGQDDLNSCPICLDELSARTVTSCGHSYCCTCERPGCLSTGGGCGAPRALTPAHLNIGSPLPLRLLLSRLAGIREVLAHGKRECPICRTGAPALGDGWLFGARAGVQPLTT